MNSYPAGVSKREHHLEYEVDMLIMTEQLLIYGEDKLDEVKRNGYLESFLIHLRNLVYFLWGPFRKDDFRPSWFSKTYKAPLNPTFNGEKKDDIVDRINKQIDHLTLNRIGPPNRQWSIREITCDYLNYFSKFLTEADNTMDVAYKNRLNLDIKQFVNKECTQKTAMPNTSSLVTISIGSAQPSAITGSFFIHSFSSKKNQNL